MKENLLIIRRRSHEEFINALETQYQLIQKQYDDCHQEVQVLLTPFEVIYQQYCNNLTFAEESNVFFSQIKKRFLSVKPRTPDAIKELFNATSNHLQILDVGPDLKNALEKAVFGPSAFELRTFFNAQDIKIETHLQKIAKLGQTASELKAVHQDFLATGILGTELATHPIRLTLISHGATLLASQLLTRKKEVLPGCPDGVDEAFFAEACALAIVKGPRRKEILAKEEEHLIEEDTRSHLMMERDEALGQVLALKADLQLAQGAIQEAQHTLGETMALSSIQHEANELLQTQLGQMRATQLSLEKALSETSAQLSEAKTQISSQAQSIDEVKRARDLEIRPAEVTHAEAIEALQTTFTLEVAKLSTTRILAIQTLEEASNQAKIQVAEQAKLIATQQEAHLKTKTMIADQDETISTLRKEMAVTQQQLSGKDKTLAELKSNLAGLQATLAQQNETIPALSKEMNLAQEQVKAKDKALRESQTESLSFQKTITQLEQQLENSKKKLTEHESTLKDFRQKLKDKSQQITTQNTSILKFHELIKKQQKTISALKEELNTFQKSSLDLKKNLFDSQKVIQTLEQEVKEICESLITKEELAAQYLLFEKLIPLTRAYLTHLLREASKHLGHLDCSNIHQELPNKSTNVSKEYLKIKEKYHLVQRAYLILTQKEGKPITHLKQFSNAIHQSAIKIKAHRDNKFLIFFRACLDLLLFIPIGGIYAFATKKSPLFFSQSKGEAYLLTAQNYLLKEEASNRPHHSVA